MTTSELLTALAKAIEGYDKAIAESRAYQAELDRYGLPGDVLRVKVGVVYSAGFEALLSRTELVRLCQETRRRARANKAKALDRIKRACESGTVCGTIGG